MGIATHARRDNLEFNDAGPELINIAELSFLAYSTPTRATTIEQEELFHVGVQVLVLVQSRAFAPLDASLADLRKILLEDGIIQPDVKFELDGVVIGRTAEVHTKWTDVLREIHVCVAFDISDKQAASTPRPTNAKDAQRSRSYPSPARTPSPGNNPGELLMPKAANMCGESQNVDDEPCSNEPQACNSTNTCEGNMENSKSYGNGSECSSPTATHVPRAGDECSPVNLEDTCAPLTESDGCHNGQPVSSAPWAGNAVDGEPSACDVRDEHPSRFPEDGQNYDERRPQNGQGYGGRYPQNERNYDGGCSESGRDCDERYPETDPAAEYGDDCQANGKSNKEESDFDGYNGLPATPKVPYKPNMRPLRLSTDGSLAQGEAVQDRTATTRSGGFNRVSMPNGLFGQRSPPKSASQSEFKPSDVASERVNGSSQTNSVGLRGYRSISDLKEYDEKDSNSSAQFGLRGKAHTGAVDAQDSKKQGLFGRLAQRPRSDSTFGLGLPSLSLGASLKTGSSLQAGVNIPLTNTGEGISANISAATSALSQLDERHQRVDLDIADAVQVIMQAHCIDNARFAALFKGIDIGVDLFTGLGIGANLLQGTDIASEEVLSKPCGAPESICSEKSQPIAGSAHIQDSRCPSVASSNKCNTTNLSIAESDCDDNESVADSVCTTQESALPYVNTTADSALAKVPLYRLYSSSAPDHFYTTNAAERDACTNYGYTLESTAAQVLASPDDSSIPFFRIYRNKEHFYTTDAAEKDRTVGPKVRHEGIVGYVYAQRQNGTIPLYRLYHPATDDHFYTTSAPEKETCIKGGEWKDEGIACYVYA